MRVLTTVTLAASLIWLPASALAQAKIVLSPYEGPPIVRVGEGGTRIQKNGIDYWTSGTPPRRYQVIGMVQDKRDETWDGGHAIGSPSIAAKVKKAGGDAIIVQDQAEAGKTGGMGFFSGGVGFLGMGGSKTITRMLVIKYLADDPPPSSESTPTSAQNLPAPASVQSTSTSAQRAPAAKVAPPPLASPKPRVTCVTCPRD